MVKHWLDMLAVWWLRKRGYLAWDGWIASGEWKPRLDVEPSGEDHFYGPRGHPFRIG